MINVQSTIDGKLRTADFTLHFSHLLPSHGHRAEQTYFPSGRRIAHRRGVKKGCSAHSTKSLLVKSSSNDETNAETFGKEYFTTVSRDAPDNVSIVGFVTRDEVLIIRHRLRTGRASPNPHTLSELATARNTSNHPLMPLKQALGRFGASFTRPISLGIEFCGRFGRKR